MEHSRTIDENPILECRHICKVFSTPNSRLEVLKDLSLSVRKNEFVVILGPGQCGKTTLVNIMAGLDHATSGEVMFHGNAVTEPNPKLGVVYQTTALFPWFTVQKNVDFGLRMKHVEAEERTARAQYFIDLVGLTGFEKSFPIKLSGGMRQRVGIARAYCNDPDVLLMDEPFGHLDAQTRYSMQKEVEKIWSQEKRAVLFVTNNIEEAVYLADRIILLTNTPTNVKQEIRVELPRPRDYTSRAFLNLRKEISGIFESTR